MTMDKLDTDLVSNARMALEVAMHELQQGRSTTKAQRAELLRMLGNAHTYLTTALDGKKPDSGVWS